MFKRHNQLFTALRVLLDACVVAGAFWGAYALRFGSPKTWPYPELPERGDVVVVFTLAMLVWPVSLHAMSLYRPQRQKSPFDEMFGVFKATVLAGLLVISLAYFLREARFSRGMLGVFTTFSFLGVSIERVFFKELLQAARRRGYNLRYILVIGTGRLARQVLEQVDLHRELGFRAVGAL